jgi:DnaK suppressor protein
MATNRKDAARTAESRLRRRGAELRNDIDREIGKYRSEADGLATANVPDRAELSARDLVADIYLTEVDRDVAELLAVEDALQRIDAGTYGTCVDCGRAIAARRLDATPHAARCLSCQRRAERRLTRPQKM